VVQRLPDVGENKKVCDRVTEAVQLFRKFNIAIVESNIRTRVCLFVGG
jgi:hypothetical protein